MKESIFRCRMRVLAGKVLALLLALALVVAYTPGLVYAAELVPQAVSYELETDEGWTLEFSVEYLATPATASLTGVTGRADGAKALVVPSTFTYTTSSGKEYEVTVTSVSGYALASSTYTDSGCNDYWVYLTSLTLPDTVTSIGNYAFYYCAYLRTVSLPESLTYIGQFAFGYCLSLTELEVPGGSEELVLENRAFAYATGLESVSIPSNVAYLPYYCFLQCTSLENVEFAEDMTLEYVGYMCFRSCSSLEKIEIPPLTGGTVTTRKTQNTLSGASYAEWRVGVRAFQSCTSLQEIVFLPGGDGSNYFLNSPGSGGQTVGNLQDIDSKYECAVVNYNRGSVPTSQYMDSCCTYYVAVNYYLDEEVAEADESFTEFTYQEVWALDTCIYDIVYGTVTDNEGNELEPYTTNGEMPTLSSDNMWVVGEDAMTDSTAGLEDGIIVFPQAAEGNLTGGYVEIPNNTVTLYDCYEYEETDDDGNTTTTVYGTPDLEGITVHYATGDVVDESLYTLVFTLVSVTQQLNQAATYSYGDNITSWSTWPVGTVAVYAKASSANTAGAGTTTTTPGNRFSTVQYEAHAASVDDSQTTSTDRNANIGFASYYAMEAATSAAAYTVICDADDWEYALIANAFAGLCDGAVLLTDGDDTHNYLWTALYTKPASAVQLIGSDEELGEEVLTRVATYKSSKSATVNQFPLSGTTVESADEMAVQVYNAIADYGEDAYGFTWEEGGTAVVVSSSKCPSATAMTQYIYEAASPVFFTNEEGTLSEDTLDALEYGGFSRVLLVGTESYVSDEVAASVQEVCGIEPERVADEDSAYSASVAALEMVEADYPDAISSGDVVVAAADDLGTVLAATLYASKTGSSLLTVAASVDVKLAQEYIYENLWYADTVKMIGDFSEIESETVERIESVWWPDKDMGGTADEMMSTEIVTGDTVERLGVFYTVTSEGSMKYRDLYEETMQVIDIGPTEIDGTAYTVSEVAEGLLEGNEYAYTIYAEATDIGDSAFAGCTALTKADLTADDLDVYALSDCPLLEDVTISTAGAYYASVLSGSTAVTTLDVSAASVPDEAFSTLTSLQSATVDAASIGEGTFAGCTALASAELSSEELTALPATCFEGCSKLASVTLPSGIQAVGEEAFSGCAALTDVSLPVATSIDAKAFYGCAALKSVSTKATSIGASAFQGCSAMTSATLSATGLTTIPASAFQGCSKLATVSIASTALTSVGGKAFYGCKKLSGITLKSTKLTSIGASAFQGCSAMTKATLSSKKLKSIPASCFNGCSKLSSVSIASTALTSVGSKAFKGCKKLKTLTIKSKKLKSVGANAFKGTKKTLTVKVPKAKVTKYKKLFVKKGLNKNAKVKAA